MADKQEAAPPAAEFQQPKMTAEQLDEAEREQKKLQRRKNKRAFAAALGPEFQMQTPDELLREYWPQIVRAHKLGLQYDRVAQVCQAQKPPITLTRAKWDSIPQYLIDQEERRKRAKAKKKR